MKNYPQFLFLKNEAGVNHGLPPIISLNNKFKTMINTRFKNILLASLLIFISQFTNAQTELIDTKPLKNSLDHVTLLQPQVTEKANMNISNSNSSMRYNEIKKIFPGAVKLEKKFYPAGKNDYRIKTVETVDHERLVPVLVESIKEQQMEIERLKSEVEALKAK